MTANLLDIHADQAIYPSGAAYAFLFKYGQGADKAHSTRDVGIFLRSARYTSVKKESELDKWTEGLLSRLPVLRSVDGRWFIPTKKSDLKACEASEAVTKKMESNYPRIFKPKKASRPAFLPGFEPPPSTERG